MVQIEASARQDVAQRAEMIDVVVQYCNDVQFIHDHRVVRDAVTEYAERLAEAIEPRPDTPHIRQVHLMLYNEIGSTIHHVDSGVFGCEHAA